MLVNLRYSRFSKFVYLTFIYVSQNLFFTLEHTTFIDIFQILRRWFLCLLLISQVSPPILSRYHPQRFLFNGHLLTLSLRFSFFARYTRTFALILMKNIFSKFLYFYTAFIVLRLISELRLQFLKFKVLVET